MCDAWRRMVDYRGAHVSVTTVAHTTLTGIVYAVDPETGNIILVNGRQDEITPRSNPSKVVAHLLTASTIEDIQLLSTPLPSPACLPRPLHTRLANLENKAELPTSIDPHVLVEKLKAQRIDARLEHQHLPNLDSRSTYIDIFSGIARILPPFGPQCVRSTNEHILSRVRAIITTIQDKTPE